MIRFRDVVRVEELRYPTFHRIFGRAELPVGLDLRWDTALRDFQIQLEPRVSREVRLMRTVPGLYTELGQLNKRKPRK